MLRAGRLRRLEQYIGGGSVERVAAGFAHKQPHKRTPELERSLERAVALLGLVAEIADLSRGPAVAAEKS
jgi:hypothetical protein